MNAAIYLQYTAEPPNKGNFGANSFVPCREVVPISKSPLSEVPLYLQLVEVTWIVWLHPVTAQQHFVDGDTATHPTAKEFEFMACVKLS